MGRGKFANIKRKISKEEWDDYILAYKLRGLKPIPYHHTHYESWHEWDFGDVSHEPIVCKHFGCGSPLTRREQLFGDYCVIHNMMGEILHK
jgi:hypothetical protein